jgi:hypothetical protein
MFGVFFFASRLLDPPAETAFCAPTDDRAGAPGSSYQRRVRIS